MDDPPPVPPKDTPYKPAMDADRTTPAPPSSSKRKRAAYDEQTYRQLEENLQTPDPDAHSPKRSRPSAQRTNTDASDDATPVRRNVRRKKGVRNLSNLNLRHAAERQAKLHAESQPLPRESKFQEGSLTDKPSDKPPSAFTRFIRTDSGNVHHVDELMADYHNGMPTPRGSVEIDIEREKAQIPQRVAAISSQPGAPKENNGFFYRFGRQIAASFHPVRMWKEVLEETTEELRQKNLAEAERKKVLKEEAERRYAQMKASGQFGPQTVSRTSIADSNISTRDSGVIFTSGAPSFEHKRVASYGSQLALPSSNDVDLHSENEAPEPMPSVIKSFKSRLSFKRPSLQNLKFDLKKAKSEYNLGGIANAQRESSSSVSPVKAEFPASALKKSHSRIDMRKQHKLSKRVSDLEVKLQVARKELDDALYQASPMPQMGNKHERFTPYSSMRRPRFVPGKLESLPSERLLDPSHLTHEANDEHRVTDARMQDAAELEANEPAGDADLMDVSEENEEETVRMSHARPYPPRASSLFNMNNKNIEHISKDTKTGATDTADDPVQYDDDDMDMDDSITVANEAHVNLKRGSYDTLDAKLKALDANVKMAAKKTSKRRKRKSGADISLRNYRPEDDDDEEEDDVEWEEATKRRKSGGSNKRKSTGKSTTGDDSLVDSHHDQETIEVATEHNDPKEVIDEAPAEPRVRKSMDSQSLALDPVPEEDSEGSAFANRDPTKKSAPKPIVNEPPAEDSQPGAEEELMTRAATAARNHRSHSPPEKEKQTLAKAVDSPTEKADEIAQLASKKSSRGRPKNHKGKVDPSFEWPEDVF